VICSVHRIHVRDAFSLKPKGRIYIHYECVCVCVCVCACVCVCVCACVCVCVHFPGESRLFPSRPASDLSTHK